MAGIEKICELSGEYPGGAMYRYKWNRIQVMPHYRKLFKGQDATLYIAPGAVYIRCGKSYRRWEYALHVPGVPGRVEGWYSNWSFDRKAVLHNMRKLLGLKSTRQLKVVALQSEQALHDMFENCCTGEW